MAKEIKLKFDADLIHQREGVHAVIDVLKGIENTNSFTSILDSDDIVSNFPLNEEVDEDILLQNISEVQSKNRIPSSLEGIRYDEGILLEGLPDAYEVHRCPHFTIEMETGTGKTYVYLRTIYELKERNEFKKFIIVVPSIAIYEGVIQAFKAMESHFKHLYNNEILRLISYDGSKQNDVKSFAQNSNGIDVLLISLDSFNKTGTNNLFKEGQILGREELPYQLIQKTRPIIILDEPQTKAGSEKNSQAIRSLKPLLVLRYSATHRDSPNLIYKLTPFDAYQKNLVKKIEVIGLENESTSNETIILNSISNAESKISAKINCNVILKNGQKKEKEVIMKQGDDLFLKTKCDDYKDKDYIVKEIFAGKDNEFIEFENGEKIFKSFRAGASTEEDFRSQIKDTILTHFKRQAELLDKNIKVLSLFFIDKVANYISDKNKNGIIKEIFEQEFENLKISFPFFKEIDAKIVQAAYFAKKQTKFGEENFDLNEEKMTKEQRDASKKAYELIMRDKATLLSFSSPVCFIFAHSALKEGWDNPNVFQICTLNQTKSIIKKRQEIGRGLRLCVDQSGRRITKDISYFEEANILTVIANESYERYADTLQSEYQEEGFTPPSKPSNAKRGVVSRREEIYESKNFNDLKNNLWKHVQYSYDINMSEIIFECINKLNSIEFPETKIRKSFGRFVLNKYKISLNSTKDGFASVSIDEFDTENNIRGRPSVKIRQGSQLSRFLKDESIRDYIVSEVFPGARNEAYVLFKNGKKITYNIPLLIETSSIQLKEESYFNISCSEHPIVNLLQRAADATCLTRHSIFIIFNGLSNKRKEMFLSNPEKITSIFISEVLAILKNHIAENIDFNPSSTYNLSKEEEEIFFPQKQSLVQHELVDADENSLYSHIPSDSEIENWFIEELKKASLNGEISCYFKFPSKFKYSMPKLIGNYNPDWAIARNGDQKILPVQLVRETKGTEKIDNLRFDEEKYKVRCAKKLFESLDTDYRIVSKNSKEKWLLTSEEIKSKNKPFFSNEIYSDRILSQVPKDEQFKNYLPIYSFEVAAGQFSDNQNAENLGWYFYSGSITLNSKMFVAKVDGKSMEPRIPDGSYCVFKIGLEGARQNKIVLVQLCDVSDPENGGQFTVKKYYSEKNYENDDKFTHTIIKLIPENPAYQIIFLSKESAQNQKIIAEFIEVIN